jgi:hypothetical protein
LSGFLEFGFFRSDPFWGMAARLTKNCKKEAYSP